MPSNFVFRIMFVGGVFLNLLGIFMAIRSIPDLNMGKTMAMFVLSVIGMVACCVGLWLCLVRQDIEDRIAQWRKVNK